jgi:hypothetical protein
VLTRAAEVRASGLRLQKHSDLSGQTPGTGQVREVGCNAGAGRECQSQHVRQFEACLSANQVAICKNKGWLRGPTENTAERRFIFK